jgi:hypothetical protein
MSEVPLYSPDTHTASVEVDSAEVDSVEVDSAEVDSRSACQQFSI